jgi:peptidoglycan/xylan/chitin deacetylase (PgdA/CDA1 family)
MVWLMALGLAVAALAHMVPVPFVLDWIAGDRAVWEMTGRSVPTLYLTYDDGPNPSTTPDLLDVLAAEHTRATFFLIDEHITAATAPIVRSIADQGHAIGLHTSTRRFMLMSPSHLARALEERADRIEAVAGIRPCRAFRPHAGWRSGQMRRPSRTITSWWVQLDLWINCFRPRNAQSTFRRIAGRASDGDIIVPRRRRVRANPRSAPHGRGDACADSRAALPRVHLRNDLLELGSAISPLASAVPSRMTALPASMWSDTGSSRNRKPQSTPNAGIR